jgi:hypothetical protein
MEGLFAAARRRDLPYIRKYLDSSNVNARDEDGNPWLVVYVSNALAEDDADLLAHAIQYFQPAAWKTALSRTNAQFTGSILLGALVGSRGDDEELVLPEESALIRSLECQRGNLCCNVSGNGGHSTLL